MKMTRRVFLGLSLMLTVAATGCATKARVMPMDNGINKVVVRDSNQSDAEEAAAEAAQKHCQGQGGKNAVFVGESSQVAGASETQKNVTKASRAASVLNQNRSRMAARSAKMSSAPSLDQIGQVGEIMTSDRSEYKAEMTFRCQ